jgi:hypothetical protein
VIHVKVDAKLVKHIHVDDTRSKISVVQLSWLLALKFDILGCKGENFRVEKYLLGSGFKVINRLLLVRRVTNILDLKKFVSYFCLIGKCVLM